MLAHRRQEEIVQEVQIKGSVLVKDLAIKYKVTEDSIRKDLALLQSQGLLKKTYGGAVKIKDRNQETYINKRLKDNREKKVILAQKAYSCIEDGDMIFLENSTTNIELARLIFEASRNITVVTNMVEILFLAAHTMYTEFIFVGGSLSNQRDCFTGSVTNEQIQRYHFDKSFISTVGVDVANERVYNNDVEGAITKKTVIECSQANYLLLENKKLEVEGGYEFALLDQFTKIILDDELDIQHRHFFEDYGLEWI